MTSEKLYNANERDPEHNERGVTGFPLRLCFPAHPLAQENYSTEDGCRAAATI